MKKLLKALSFVSLSTTLLFANINDEKIIEFENNRISQNPNVEVLNVDISFKKQMPLKDWYGYILNVQAEVQASKDSTKVVNVKDILFTNGEYVSLDLIDLKTGKSLKSEVSPKLTSNYYNKEKLIAGNHNAKDKIVIFSDPLCPFCMDYVPDVIEYVNKNSKNISLYYYHFPLLRIHPAAGPLSKIMEIAKHKNIKDLELKVYSIDWDKYFNSKSIDEKKILESFNKEFKTNITLEELKKVDIQSDIKMGDDVMVQGTPTIFINGQKDNTKLKYQTLGK
ncbi:DsbA family protein [Arcobacter sp. YIC-464]|uniref:DsbA family protein n=1 Tax=Arcobacter sp. YIC-464 TaxID=3376631 RepID=UPI003C282F20